MKALIALLVAFSFLEEFQASDCFGWSITKRANYMELLPQLLYYDQVNWINLDPNRTCTFKTYEAVFLQLINKNLTASYQVYRENSQTGKCILSNQAAKPFRNNTWLYSNHKL